MLINKEKLAKELMLLLEENLTKSVENIFSEKYREYEERINIYENQFNKIEKIRIDILESMPKKLEIIVRQIESFNNILADRKENELLIDELQKEIQIKNSILRKKDKKIAELKAIGK